MFRSSPTHIERLNDKPEPDAMTDAQFAELKALLEPVSNLCKLLLEGATIPVKKAPPKGA